MSSNQRTEAARRRIEASRAEQQRRTRRRRQLVVGIAALALLGAGTGIGIAVQSSRATSDKPYVAPAHSGGPGGTVIVYGNPAAKATLQVYEDFRCPVCARLEHSAGSTIQQLADRGEYRIEYHFGTFLDGNLGGHGSRTALNAAGAALNESAAKFKAFHDVLYADQPEETNDGFADTATLLKLAAKVPGLSTPAFTRAVRDMTYEPWVSKVSEAFDTSGVTGTPTVRLNGKDLPVVKSDGSTVTGPEFTALVSQGLAG
ncbi:DsbA family protein [Streptacidiphilus griseoplanus]|uniref:DsbA family protein n=1 Tax=Peterkaempfera griseoplana TaxID=66896 RepID=UPI0006E2C92D|nr:thioredoxin domain-containing protein [Peterkaempfera griseoplana]